jgi:hypothetical protein
MAARPSTKSPVLNSTDALNKQPQNHDIALELVTNYLSSGAYKNNQLNTTEELSGQQLNNIARMDGYYIASLYKYVKEWLDKSNNK